MYQHLPSATYLESVPQTSWTEKDAPGIRHCNSLSEILDTINGNPINWNIFRGCFLLSSHYLFTKRTYLCRIFATAELQSRKKIIIQFSRWWIKLQKQYATFNSTSLKPDVYNRVAIIIKCNQFTAPVISCMLN